ncbi:cell division FtsZ family protein [Patescibacteria group bacterium]|nr:cell division FtsZ family protein [Patescibacteria group bacterium]
MVKKKSMAKKKKTKPRTTVRKKRLDKRTGKKVLRGKKIEKKKKTLKPTKKRKVKVKAKLKVKKRVKIRRKPKRTKSVKRRTIVRKKVRVKPPFSDITIHKTKIRVIGIGGGGGSIVSEIVSRIKKADFVIANTDIRSLRAVRQVKRFQFGQSLTKGLGTGMNTELGELAALDEKEKIKKLFEGQDLCIIVACLGGGTGSGATPVFAKISKNLGCLTYGIFTLPFEFEGEKKMEIAKESLEKIRPNLNAYSVIPNERIFQIIDKDTPLKDALSAINERLAENLEGLIGMIYLPGLINIDFADLRTILGGRGRLSYLNTIEIEEPDREEVAKKVISSPLYPYTIKGAKGILYNIVGGKTLQLSEVSQLSKIIADSINKNAKIIFGISQGQKYQGKIKITLLATGCGKKRFLLKPTEKKTKSFTFRKKPKRKKKTPKTKKPKIEKKEKPKSKTKIVRKPKSKPKVKIKEKIKIKTKRKTVSKKALSRTFSRLKKVRGLIKKKPRKTKPKKEKVIPKTKRQLKRKEKKTKGPARHSPKAKPMAGEKVRRNALQLKKVIEEEEKELLEREKIWETPAIFRRKIND